ncbi:DUF642 domain-containing protein, partial [Flavobacterium sp. MC2016-06]|uniref:beta strand repeat-containing protein n=1 Tax=Flavobacterium sp. MC2016-06 TaxID=2676308 RepID=UPI0031D0545E
MIVQFSQIDGDAHFWSFDKFSENKAVLTGRIKYLLIVLFSVFVNSVSGQITQPTAWTKPYDQTTLTATGTSFAIAAGSNRILVVGVTTTYTEGGGSGIQADPTITYGGVSLTKATGNGGTNGRMHTWLYYLKDNTVMDATSRAFNVTGGAVTNATLANMTVWYGVFAGVDQSPASYTTGNGFSNTGANGPATLSAAMTVNTNEQAVYITSIYNDNSAAIPSYTINTNWTSGGTNSGNVNSGGNVAWKNEVAKRSIPGSNTTDQAATSTITPNNNIRFAMSAISFPRVTTPTITSLGSASACEGGSITINGTNLSGVTAANVKIGGTAVSSITSNSATQIVAVVGSGTTGTVTVTTTGGTATSAATFTVNPSPTTSNAGIDQYGTSASFTLAANTPTSGTGAWTITSGPSTSLAQFSSTSSPTATFTPSGSGSYVLTWTITNSCGSSTDDVIIANCVGNLIINGDFAAQTANWTAATTRGTTAETNVENTYFSSGNNDYTAELDYEASLRQVVSVIPGVSYTVTFLYARRENASTPATTDVTVKITGGTSVITSPSLTTTNSTPKVGTLTFTATSSSIGVEFYNTLNTAGQTLGTIIDNIVLVPSSQVTPVATTVPKGIYKTLTSCAGLSVQLDVENVPASGVTYAWTGNAGTVFSSTTIKNPTVTFSGTGILQATVTVTTASGCSGIPSTTYVNFIANPTITTAATPAVVTAVCQSASVQTTTMAYTAATDSPTSYSIDWATLTDQGSTSFAFASGGGNVTGISVPAGTASGTYLGTMTITNANGCIGTKAITLTVNQSPTITTQPSSSAICPGTNKVFSVTTAGAGTLTYAWQISTNGGTTFTALTNGGIYSNVTTASMTLTAPAGTLANNQYRCVVSGGTCTPTSVTSNAGVLTFNASPAGLSYTSATVSYCLNTAIATNSATLTTAGSPAVTYSATLPAGLSIDTATGAITGTPTAVSAAANYTVTATNTCGFTTRVLNITVNSLPVISTQPQALAVCENGSGAFTISTSASSPSYFWEYSADGLTNWLTTNGVAGVTGYNTASLNLSNTPLGYSGNYVRCTITSGSCSIISNTARLTVNPLPAAAGAITGTGTVCQGQSGVTYSVTAITNATGYTWTLPTGASITSGSNTNSITVSYSASAASGTVTVQGTNTCGNGTVSSGFSITVNPLPAAAGAITGSGTVCQGQTGVTYSVPAIANATGYTWTLPTGASITSGTNTRSITVSYSASAASGTVTVQGTNGCGSGTV